MHACCDVEVQSKDMCAGDFVSAMDIGSGLLVFTPTANYTGPITLTAGTIRWGDANGNTPLTPVVSGGAITAAAGTTISTFRAPNAFDKEGGISNGLSRR